MGQVIIVTGTTGSGKTTTCREIIAQAEDVWLHFGVDLFLGQCISRKFIDGGTHSGTSMHMAPDDPDDPDGPAHMSFGTHGKGLIAAYHEMIAAAVQSGQTVVLDHVMTVDPPILQDAVSRLGHLPVLLVALKPPQGILAERIAGRIAEVEKVLGREQAERNNAGTRKASEFVHREIFRHDCFDMVLDTGELSPGDAARAIIDRVENGPPGTAFAKLAELYPN